MNAANHSTPRTFLLQDSRGNTGDNLMFWARAGGYTSSLELAQLFDEKSAFAQHDSRHSDVPWPQDYLRQHTHRVVDMQYVKVEEAKAWHDQERFYCQSKAHGFVGNDLVFLAKDGKRFVINLDEAKVFTREEALLSSGAGITDVFWPTGYIDFKSRLAANSRTCSIADALKTTGRELIKEKRVVERYRCHSCHVFLSAATYYAGSCPRCGTQNRP